MWLLTLHVRFAANQDSAFTSTTRTKARIMQDKLRERLGSWIKGVLGEQPVRLRFEDGSTCFLLCDCTDAKAGQLVRDVRQLQIVGGATAPLVIDIDSLHRSGVKQAADAAFSTQRLVCATRVLGAMLGSRFGICMHWFSSGKQGVHGFAFGTTLTKPMRDLVASLLPGDERVFQNEAWASEAVITEVEAGLRHLLALDLSTCDDAEWLDRLRAADNSAATLTTKLLAVTAFYDTCVTSSAQIRVPLAYNAKGCGYAGFPLPKPESVSTEWPSLRRLASVPLVANELDLLESIEPHTSEERMYVVEQLQVSGDQVHRKRALSEMEERQLQNWAPRLHPRPCTLPTNAAVRSTLIPWPVREKLTVPVVDALERGMQKGGHPPCSWKAEPADEYRLDVSARGGGTKRSDQPLALEALAGLNLTSDGRGSVVRALLVSSFPVDYFAEALMASTCVRRDVLGHWGSWFDTLAKGRAKVGSAAWNYDGGFFTQVGTQCPVVLKQCARAASILLGRNVIYGAKSPGTVRNPRRPTAANRDDTGRRVTLQLTHSVAEQLALVRPALQDRAKHETSAEGSVTNRSEKLLAHAERDLRALHTAATNGTLTFTEYIAPEGRLGYDCAGYCNIKNILRELRPILFPCMWRVDVRRCHTTMLLGAHARAVSLQSAPDDHLLRRMRTDMGGIESELRSGQQGLLESARTRLEHARGSDGEENARTFLGYLQMEPKTLLSVMLNHPNRSPMFRDWPLAADYCRAMGVAAAVARSHPLVSADCRRPELAGITPGSRTEKQRIAFLLERRAVTTIVDVLHREGLAPSITINDEVLFAAPTGDPSELVQLLEQALEAKLGFVVNLSAGPL